MGSDTATNLVAGSQVLELRKNPNTTRGEAYELKIAASYQLQGRSIRTKNSFC